MNNGTYVGYPNYLNFFQSSVPQAMTINYFSNYYVISFIPYISKNITFKMTNIDKIIGTCYVGIIGAGGAGSSVNWGTRSCGGGGGGGGIFYGPMNLTSLSAKYTETSNITDYIKFDIILGAGGTGSSVEESGSDGTFTSVTVGTETITCSGGKGAVGRANGVGGTCSGSITGVETWFPSVNTDGSFASGGHGNTNGCGSGGQGGTYFVTEVGSITFAGGGGGAGLMTEEGVDIITSGSGGYGGGGNGGNIIATDGYGFGYGGYAMFASGSGGGGAISVGTGTNGVYITGGKGADGTVIFLIPYPERNDLPFSLNTYTDYYFNSENFSFIIPITNNTLTITTSRTTLCSFFIIGAGGGGGGGYESSGTVCSSGSGGGGGEVIYVENIEFNTGEVIQATQIGQGGTGGASDSNGNNGTSTIITIKGVEYIANGGSGGLSGVEGENNVLGGSGTNSGGQGTYSVSSLSNTSNGYQLISGSNKVKINNNEYFGNGGAGGGGTCENVKGGQGGTELSLNGTTPIAYGSGGGGGFYTINSSGTAGSGGNGSNGCIIVLFSYLS